MQRIDPQHIKHIPLTALPLPPLGRLHGTQIVRRVDVADLPLPRPRHLPLQIFRPLLPADVVEGLAVGVVVADGFVILTVDAQHHGFGEGDATVAGRGAGGGAGDA